MINLRLNIRRASAQDHRSLSNLLVQETHTHRHLDWRPALEWLGARNFWVLEDFGVVTAALACPEDPPDVAWIRLFTHNTHLSGPEAWSALWEFASADLLSSNPRIEVGAIVMKQWFQALLLQTGFEPRQKIVLLELHEDCYRPAPAAAPVRIRAMNENDLDEVEELDRGAFGAFWHNSYDSIQRAWSQSLVSTVAENANGIAGYQISTGNQFGVHLARLGVRVEAQGRGVASSLMHDLIQKAGGLRSGRLSVNTQEDNLASLRLYEKLGFMPTGEYYPVLVRRLGGQE